MCDLALTWRYRQFSETAFLKEKKVGFGRFFEGKKVTKGSAMLLSWQHRTSPFLQLLGWVTGQTENTRCVNRVLIKLVPVKFICVNALLTLKALIYIYIYIYIIL